MDHPRDWNERRTYYARFEDGPRGGTQTAVLALESGQPPELLLTPGQRGWIYVLAGAERRDGSLPYLWMPRSRVAALLGDAPRAPEPVIDGSPRSV